MTSEQQYEEVLKKLDEIYDRLFVDNSSPSFQTRIDRNTRWIRNVGWGLGVIYTAIIGMFVWLFKK